MQPSADLPIEWVPLDQLKAHPRNYRHHPEDQLDHLVESIKQHGLYRALVVAEDGTLLAGHGVKMALLDLGWETAPVIRLPVAPDSPQALKVLAGDNEIGHLGERDDRLLSELLKEIRDDDLSGLLGTGFDDKMLANLVYVTRPASEVQDFQEAAHWVGMPDYEEEEAEIKLVVRFRNEEHREHFAHLLGMDLPDKAKSVWWPQKDREDLSSLRFEG